LFPPIVSVLMRSCSLPHCFSLFARISSIRSTHEGEMQALRERIAAQQSQSSVLEKLLVQAEQRATEKV
jgi:hypothetical protein